MQGNQSSLSTLPENISFDHGSSSSDAAIDFQMPWNSIQTESNIQYVHHVSHEGLNDEWSLGGTSSGSIQNHQHEQNERKREQVWTIQSRASLNLEEPSNVMLVDNVDLNANITQITNGPQILGTNALPQDLNMLSGFGYNEDDDCQVLESPNTCISIGSSNEHIPREDIMAGCPMDGQRVSCKRKTIEGDIGQSSGVGSSNFFNHAERTQWHDFSGPIAPTGPTRENGPVGPEYENPRFRLGVSATPLSMTARGPFESARRNIRLRVNGAHQQDHVPGPDPFLVQADIRNSDISSSRHSSGQLVPNHLFDLNPSPPVENGQSMPLNVPSMRRNHKSRWNGASSSRTSNSSTSTTLYEEPSTRNVSRSVSQHPMFVPASEIGSSSQQNYNLVDNMAGNAAPSSQVGPNSGPSSSSSTWAHRSCPQYPRRLSAIVRRSLLSSAGTQSGGQSQTRNHGIRSSSSQETTLSSGFGINGHVGSNSRAALLERHLDGAITVPYSLRTLAAGGEGRSNIMSEIRHVLDLMRRGEGLRIEDVMLLDHSVLFGMADIHDRHHDMRLDVDNMSYEELLALGERIGHVCTGLTEQTITSHLKLQKYTSSKIEDQLEKEPCSICREEYNDGEDVGTLECGHNFHKECIKQWLLQKNLCPICKTTGLTT